MVQGSPVKSQIASKSASGTKSYASYEALLSATSGGSPDTSGTQAKGRYEGPHYSELQRETLAFKTQLDLPLIFRRDLVEGIAYADLQSQGTQIKIVSLTGNPYIRAALFEALGQAKNRGRLQDIFKFFKTESFRLIFSVKTLYAPYKNSEFDDQVEIFDREVRIQVTHHLGTSRPSASGLEIEDEHSRKAKIRDHQHLLRLQSSPAFLHPIFDFILP